jgi:dTDP-glucose 4,6-dehydratase
VTGGRVGLPDTIERLFASLEFEDDLEAGREPEDVEPRLASVPRPQARRTGGRDFRRLLVTGGAGFIGSAFVRAWLRDHPDSSIVVLDKLTYAGNPANLATCEADPGLRRRFRLVVGDIADRHTVEPLVAAADAVVNFAAESHVDRSILDPAAFLRTGVLGVHTLLEAVRRAERPIRFLQVSTDEVYGAVEEGASVETDPMRPRSPYAAAKAAGEHLVYSYVITHGVDAVTTRGSNTYGPYHHPEKVIPLFITNAIDHQPLPLYGDGLQRRDWLFVDDHVGAIETVLLRGEPGGVYNVPGASELTNLELTTRILAALGRDRSLIRHVADRPGHDRRYKMDGSRTEALGWRPQVAIEDGLSATIGWFLANEDWWRPLKSGDWLSYYARQYAVRLADGTPEPAERPDGTAPPGAPDPPNGAAPDGAPDPGKSGPAGDASGSRGPDGSPRDPA